MRSKLAALMVCLVMLLSAVSFGIESSSDERGEAGLRSEASGIILPAPVPESVDPLASPLAEPVVSGQSRSWHSERSTDALAVFVRDQDIYYSVYGHAPRTPRPVTTDLAWEWWSNDANGTSSAKIPDDAGYTEEGDDKYPTVAFSRVDFAIAAWTNEQHVKNIDCTNDGNTFQVEVRKASILFATWEMNTGYDKSKAFWFIGSELAIEADEDTFYLSPSIAIDNNGNGLLTYTKKVVKRANGCPDGADVSIEAVPFSATRESGTFGTPVTLYATSEESTYDHKPPLTSTVSFSAKLAHYGSFTRQWALVAWWVESDKYSKDCGNYEAIIQTYWPAHLAWNGSAFQGSWEHIPDVMTPPSSLDDNLSVYPNGKLAISTDQLSEPGAPLHSHVEVDWIVTKQQGNPCDAPSQTREKEAWSARWGGAGWEPKAYKFKDLQPQASGIAIAYLPNNDAVVVNDKGSGDDIQLSRETYEGEPGTTPLEWKHLSRLNNAEGFYPTVASLAHSKTVVLWTKDSSSGPEIMWSEAANEDIVKDNAGLWSEGAVLAAGSDVDFAALTGSPTLPHAEWSTLFYQAADNNLEKFDGIASPLTMTDGEEMQLAGSSSLVNVVSLFDVYSDYKNGSIIYMKQGSYSRIRHLGDVNTGSPQTLEDFIVMSTEAYPAKRNMLVLSNHGLGFASICSDDHAKKSSMDMAELYSALKNANMKFDILGFNACLMAMTEVAYQVRDYTHYVVASEEVTIGMSHPLLSGMISDGGWPMHQILFRFIGSPYEDTGNLTKDIVDINDANWKSRHSIRTFSSIETSKIEDLVESLDHFAKTAQQEMVNNKSAGKRLVSAVRRAESFKERTFVDIHNFATKVNASSSFSASLRQAAGWVVANVTASVSYNKAGPGHPNAKGLSIWLPVSRAGYDALYIFHADTYFSWDTDWGNFVFKLMKEQSKNQKKKFNFKVFTGTNSKIPKSSVTDYSGKGCGYDPDSGNYCNSIESNLTDCEYYELENETVILLPTNLTGFNWTVYGDFLSEATPFHASFEMFYEDNLTYSETISGTVQPNGTVNGTFNVPTPPSPPHNLQGSWDNSNGITLTWDYPEDDGGLPVQGYYIYRGTDPDLSSIVDSTSNTASYTDYTTDDKTKYFYWMSGYNQIGEGLRSDWIEVPPPIYDSDSDGVVDGTDNCPMTPFGETVDEYGCSNSQVDSDGDGVNNTLDICPDTLTSESVDEAGCSDSQLDSDSDGVSDDIDACPGTLAGALIDSTGCEIVEDPPDSDSDGVPDEEDDCPDTSSEDTVDEKGCTETIPADDSTSDSGQGDDGGGGLLPGLGLIVSMAALALVASLRRLRL